MRGAGSLPQRSRPHQTSPTCNAASSGLRHEVLPCQIRYTCCVYSCAKGQPLCAGVRQGAAAAHCSQPAYFVLWSETAPNRPKTIMKMSAAMIQSVVATVMSVRISRSSSSRGVVRNQSTYLQKSGSSSPSAGHV